jgi:hypothetical protein
MNAMEVGPPKGKRSHPVRRVSLALLALVGIGLTSAKAFIALTPRSFSTGTLSGTLETVGEPSGADPRAVGGTITATSNAGVLSFPVASDGRFTVQAVVGTYTVTARSSQYEAGTADCHTAGPVTVTKGLTTRVQVECGE